MKPPPVKVNSMQELLRLLIVEDSEDDTELLLLELKRGNYNPEYQRVDTADAMRNALNDQTWDLVISDFSMPQFNAFFALELLHDMKIDIPFIIVSGTIGEDRAVTAMKLGASDYILKGNLKRLVPAVERELRESHNRRARRKADETILHLAYTDTVTGLPNRIRFQELVHEAIQAGQSEQNHTVLLLMDIDHFKEVNDTLGHSLGDSLLQQVGARLRGALVASDVVARLGGDEFGILSQLATVDDIKQLLQKIQGCLILPFIIDGIPISVETSIGVASVPEHANDAVTLLQLADIAMYRAKQMASNYVIYSPEFNLHSHARLGLMAELRDAIEKNQLLLHFQPKLELKTNRIVGKEALVRWQHPLRGLIPPDKFITAAEQTGHIGPLTQWVLIDALSHCHDAWHAGPRLRLSVNLSARSLHEPQLLKIIAEALEKTGAEPEMLVLEVTESAIVLDPRRAEENLAALSNMGVRLSIDDFGTGYTSLSSIKRLPVNEIKIDKSFVTNMLTDKKDAMIVRTIIEFGHNFGLTVVAEGVETQAVLDALVALGCDEVQGYFISRPLAYDPLKTWLSSSPYTIGLP